MRKRNTHGTAPHTAAKFGDALAALDAHADRLIREERGSTRNGRNARAEDYAEYNARVIARREREPRIDTID